MRHAVRPAKERQRVTQTLRPLRSTVVDLVVVG